jgi:hypothetical protein
MSLSKKIRFEVFKRDKFTCQYCGHSAPDVTLQVDHIHPVSKGGDDDLVNLVTSCRDCNVGKSNRLLDDDAAVKQRKRQLDELQERREQLEMMLEWHRSLINLESYAVDGLVELWGELVPGFKGFTDYGLRCLGKWYNKFGINEVAEAMRLAVRQYLNFESGSTIPTRDSLEKAIDYVPRICENRRRMKDKPYLSQLYYIRGILRNRLSYINKWKTIKLLEAAYQNGHDIDELREFAKQVKNWSTFRSTMEVWAMKGDGDEH